MKAPLARGTHRPANRYSEFRRKTLTLAIGSAIAIGFSGIAWGQATRGTIHGAVPVAPGEVIQVTSSAGFNRTIKVGSSGRYSLKLPLGTYTVTLLQHGT